MAETLTIRTASSTEVIQIAVPGPQGATGQGVPVGGTTGQVLRKASGTNYDTEWAAAGSGSGSVTSVALAGTGLSISGSPITTSGTITANVSYGTTAGTAAEGNDSRFVTASTTTPAAIGTAAVGTGTTFARSDHVHNLPTSPILNGDVTISGASAGVTGTLQVGNTTGSFSRDIELNGTGVVLRNNGSTGTVTIARGGGGSNSYTLTPPNASGTIALLSNFLSATKDMIVLAPSADVTVASNITLAGVSGMSFAAAATTTYLFVCYWQVDAGAGGYRMVLNVPSNFQGAATQNGYGINISGANSATGVSTIGADALNIQSVSRAAAQTGPTFSIFAFRTTGTGGTAEFRYSQASSNAANSTLKAESRVLVIPIAS